MRGAPAGMCSFCINGISHVSTTTRVPTVACPTNRSSGASSTWNTFLSASSPRNNLQDDELDEPQDPEQLLAELVVWKSSGWRSRAPSHPRRGGISLRLTFIYAISAPASLPACSGGGGGGEGGGAEEAGDELLGVEETWRCCDRGRR